MTRGELDKLEELFKMAYTNKVYCDAEAKAIEEGLDDIYGLKVDIGCGVFNLRIELLDKDLLKVMLIGYVERLKLKKAEAIEAFKNTSIEFPEDFVDKFGKPDNMPNFF